MAQILNITIRINETGSNKIDEIIAKIKKLNESFEASSFSPFQIGIENINTALQRVVSSVEAIQSKVNSTISSIKGQTHDIADNSGTRALEEANKGMETLLGRVGLVAVGVGLIQAKIGLASFATKNMTEIFSSMTGNVGLISDLFSAIGSKMTLFRSNVTQLQSGYAIIGNNLNDFLDLSSRIYRNAFNLQSIYSTFLGGIPTFSTFFSGLYTASLSIGGLLTQFAGGLTYFFGFKYLLGEVSILLRRVTGSGMESLSVLERGTRLITFFDDGLNRSFNTIGKVLKLGGLGIFTYFSPLLGAIPLVNSITDVFMVRSRMVKDRIARFFGDGRASWALILHDLRKLLTDILPGLLKIGEKFSSTIKNLKTNEIEGIFQKLFGIEKKTKSIFGNFLDFSKSPILNAFNKIVSPIGNLFNKVSAPAGNYFKTIVAPTNSPLRSSTATEKVPENQVKKSIDFKNVAIEINKNLDSALSGLRKSLEIGLSGLSNFVKSFKSTKIDIIDEAASKELLKKDLQEITSKANSDGLKETRMYDSLMALQERFEKDVAGGMRKIHTNAPGTRFEFEWQIQQLAKEGQGIFAFTQLANPSSMEYYWDIAKKEFSKHTQKKPTRDLMEQPDFKDMVRATTNIVAKQGLPKSELIKLGGDEAYQQFKSEIDKIYSLYEQSEKKIEQKSQKSSFISNFFSRFKSKAQEPINDKNIEQQISATTKKQAGYTQSQRKDILKSFDFSSLSFSQIPKSKLTIPASGLIDSIERNISDSVSQKFPKIKKILETFFTNIAKIQGIEGGKVSAVPMVRAIKTLFPELEASIKEASQKLQISGTSLGNLFQKSVTAGFRQGVSPESKQAVAKMTTTFTSVLEAGMGRTLKSGEKISKQVSIGMSDGIPEIRKNAEKIARVIGDHFPQSPVKAGPLRFLDKMGYKIPYYIAHGIDSGSGYTQKAVASMTEKMAKYFPRSLPVLGPLVGLVSMGIKIPFYIAHGIESGLSFISNIMNSLTMLIEEPMKRIREMGKVSLLSQRIGVNTETVSALGAAVEHLGGNSSELDFVLMRIQETLSKALTNEEINKFNKLGMSIESIKKSSNPAYTALENVADVLKKFGNGSKEAKEALDSFGITNTSVLVNILSEGKKGLQETISEIAKFGGIVDGNTAQSAKSISMIESKIKKFKDYLFNDFIKTILPQVEDVSKTIFSFLDRNVLKIRTFVIVIGQIISNLSILIFKSMESFLQSPGKIFDGIFKTIKNFFKQVIDSIGLLFSSVETTLVPFMDSIGNFIGNSLGTLFPALTKKIGLYIDLLWAKTVVSLYDFFPQFTDFLLSIPGKLADFWKYLFKYQQEIFVGYFLDLEKWLEEKILSLISNVVSSMKGGVAEKMLRFLGMDSIFDAVVEIDKSKTDIEKSMDERRKAIMEKLRKEREALKSQNTPDAKLDEILNKIKNDDSLSKGFAEATKNIGSDLDKILEQAKNLGDNLSKPEIWDKMQQNASQSLDEIKNIFAGLGLKEEIDKLLSSLSPENFTNVLSNLQSQIQNPLQPQGKQAEKKKTESGGFLDNLLHLKPTIDTSGFEDLLKLGESIGQVWSGLGNVFNEFYEATGKKMRAFAIMARGLSLGEAIINVAVGVTKALSSLPPPLSFMQAASVSMSGGLQIAKIMSQGFAQGGLISEGTGPTADDVNINASKGEYVLKAGAVGKYGLNFIESLNNLQFPKLDFSMKNASLPSATWTPKTHYATGGVVTGQSQSKQTQTTAKQPQYNILNFTDKNELGKYIASSAGIDILVNVIQNNGSRFRQAMGT